jgi:hypothetical protein
VARREGLPNQIVNVGQSGRVFVYKAKKKGDKPKRFAFDAAGKRVDEELLMSQATAKPEVIEVDKDKDALPMPDLEMPKK